ncbi:MAG: tellurite resistance TerB family protein [Rhodospirillales bacterium]|nr:tellurite resistance TerB family protein [Rhodospirillales bacterium]
MDINGLINGFLGSGSSETAQSGNAKSQGVSSALGGLPGGLAGGAAAGSVVALMLGSKKARKLGGKALTYGGMAVVGGLAYKAYQNYKSNQQGTPTALDSVPTPPSDSGFDPALVEDARGNDMRLALIQAMISAAKADGHVDADENQKIREQIEATQLGADEKGFLFDQLSAESDPIAIARLAKDEPQASEIYLVSALTIDIDTPEERRYMERLGDALRLPRPLLNQLQEHADAAKAAAE